MGLCAGGTPPAELLGPARRMREPLGVAAPPYERIVRERGVAAVRAALEHDALAGAWERGRDLGFEDAMARARALAERPTSTTLAEH
ncbi:MAG TPA: hypothetical protein VHF51_04615 [Solirubrobacteraceae bacterium]|nr:hypothetical protein [Solirubrobacteraceae bacterium]